jgi:hypothetical protein
MLSVLYYRNDWGASRKKTLVQNGLLLVISAILRIKPVLIRGYTFSANRIGIEENDWRSACAPLRALQCFMQERPISMSLYLISVKLNYLQKFVPVLQYM